MIYGADSESGSVNPAHYTWKRGIRIGSAKDGKVIAFIPDPIDERLTLRWSTASSSRRRPTAAGAGGTLAAEGVVVDKDGIIYGAEVGPHKLQRYVKK
jgi:hypothetical protein